MLLATLLALAAQDATLAKPEAKPDGTQRWSILVEQCPAPEDSDQIVVCASGVPTSPRLPLPGERGPPDRPMASNPDLTGAGALAAVSDPCATRSRGCTTGVDLFSAGTFAVRALGKLIDPKSCCEEPGEATSIGLLIRDGLKAAGRIGRKKPDKSNRVPIPLDDPAPREDGAGP